MQINDQRSDRGELCMTPGNTSVSFYSEAMIQKIDSVCAKGTSYGLPPENTVTMKQLTYKIQELELERKNTEQRYERELQHMKLEQQLQRSEYESQIRLLKQHLEEAQTDAKGFESMVARLTMQLRQMEAWLLNSEGTDSPDCSEQVLPASPSSSSGCSRADSGEHQYYTARSVMCELREEIAKTVVCSRGCLTSTDGRGGSQDEGGCSHPAMPKSREFILEQFHRFRLRLDEGHAEMVKSLESRRLLEIESHRSAFSDTNSEMTKIVSQSLECLSNCPDSEGFGADLQWLQKNLEDCRVERHMSCP